VVLVALAISSPQGRADDPNSDAFKIQQGFAIAPVPLNLSGRNRALVGMGSYLVNAVGDCNGCHSQGPVTEFTANGNPYLLPPVFSGTKKVNPAVYLGGGNDFGPLVPGSAHIVSRNLTPDMHGRPEGGNSFSQFLQILRTGVDMDQLHPTCHGNTVGPNCVPFPFNGALLQIMPWPNFQNMTDNDIRAIYEYLSAIPCIDTVITGEPQLRNTCK
jgi:hypothetical protein